ncbi:hypothetical protein AIGOOFII_1797 [Methylobacterium marchantiae]|nr:hypothetical protein AIGOOFII_1797 [Methylobacterium marchantiae]
MDRPVEPFHAVVTLDARPFDHDVVAVLTIVIRIVALAVQNIVSDDGAVEEELRVLARETVETLAALDPVVAFVAQQCVGSAAAEDEVVAEAAEHLLRIGDSHDEVLPCISEEQIETRAAVDDVIAEVAPQDIVTERVLDDVVAIAAEDVVGFHAGIEVVVAAIAPEGIDALVAVEPVVPLRAPEHEVLPAADLQNAAHVVKLAIDGDLAAAGVVPHDLGIDRLLRCPVPDGVQAVLCDAAVEFEDVIRGREQRPVEVGRIEPPKVGVAHHQIGEGVRFEIVEKVQPLRPAQVVETVAVLEMLHLVFEDEIEGRAQHPAEFVQLFGQAADPEIDRVEAAQAAAGIGAGGVQEGQSIGGDGPVAILVDAQDQLHRRMTLGIHRRRPGNGLVGAVSRDEVDDRHRILDVLSEVGPARVGLEIRVTEISVELPPGLVERGNTGVAGAGDIERRQIERQAEQVAAHVLDDELVHLVADIAREAADDGAVRGGEIDAGAEIHLRIEESFDERCLIGLVVDGGQVVVEPVDRARQHRVPEAIDHVRELGHDGRVDVCAVGKDERIDIRLNAAREFLEDEMLVLHFGDQARGLEETVSVPVEPCGRRGNLSDVRLQPFVDEDEIAGGEDRGLVLLDQSVVL